MNFKAALERYYELNDRIVEIDKIIESYESIENSGISVIDKNIYNDHEIVYSLYLSPFVETGVLELVRKDLDFFQKLRAELVEKLDAICTAKISVPEYPKKFKVHFDKGGLTIYRYLANEGWEFVFSNEEDSISVDAEYSRELDVILNNSISLRGYDGVIPLLNYIKENVSPVTIEKYIGIKNLDEIISNY